MSYLLAAAVTALLALGLAVRPVSAAPLAEPGTVAVQATGAMDGPAAWRRGRSAALLAILDEHHEWVLREEPLTASSRGDRRYHHLLSDESAEAHDRRLRERRDRLARLEALMSAAEGWTEADRTDADLLRHELTTEIEAAAFHPEQTPVDRLSGPQVWLPQMADGLAFTTREDYAAYLARLEAVPRQIEQHIDNMRRGLEAGRVPPRVVIEGTDAQAALMAGGDFAETPALSPFFRPFRALPERDPLAAQAAEVIRAQIVPAYQRLADFLREQYIPAGRPSIGISQGVDGVAAYEHLLRRYTTTDLSAEQIHEIGLAEVDRLRAAMLRVIGRTDWPQKSSFEGDERFARFVEYLRTDPRFYFERAEDLLAGYRDIAKRTDPALARLFGTLPRTPYGVREMPAFAAPSSPTAYYYHGSREQGLPGFFIANTYRLDQRPRYEMVALTLHEACPGHHLQVALAQELEGVHPFRTLTGVTAFVEGWGLYAEKLGLEIAADGSGERVRPPEDDHAPGTGLYSDPYDDFGRLTYEVWRACRLVVDTGIHAKGWSRQQAIDFMTANTALSAHNIEREVDRYISWPGQACAYKIGELKISELRRRAESTLGERFDVRAFHDCVLAAGAVPLPALEARVDRWIASVEQAAP